MSRPQTTVTQLLKAASDGNRAALDELYPLIYNELHVLADRQRQGWHGNYTMNTTALVNEAYFKLVDQTRADWTSRAHFFAVASKIMRNLLLDYAKKCRTQKRGGDVQKVTFDEMQGLLDGQNIPSDGMADLLEALDEALTCLAQRDARQSQIVEYRFFGGMTIKETAAALGIAPATVSREWTMARAWLYREIAQLMQA